MELNNTQDVTALVMQLATVNYSFAPHALLRTDTLTDCGDSMDLVGLVMNIEDDANVEIPDDTAADFVTFEDVIRHVCNARNIEYVHAPLTGDELARSNVYALLDKAAEHEATCAHWRNSCVDLMTLLHMDTSHAERERIAKLGNYVARVSITPQPLRDLMDQRDFIHDYIVRAMIADGYNEDTQLPLVAPSIVANL